MAATKRSGGITITLVAYHKPTVSPNINMIPASIMWAYSAVLKVVLSFSNTPFPKSKVINLEVPELSVADKKESKPITL